MVPVNPKSLRLYWYDKSALPMNGAAPSSCEPDLSVAISTFAMVYVYAPFSPKFNLWLASAAVCLKMSFLNSNSTPAAVA